MSGKEKDQNPTRETAAKKEEAPAAAAMIPSAPPPPALEDGEYEEEEGEYYEDPEPTGGPTATGGHRNRPLPEIPSDATPGQSRSQELEGGETVSQGRNAHSNLDSERVPGHYDAFILRNLPLFRSEYSGSAITEWVQKIELLFQLTSAPDNAILPLLPLRMDTQGVNFMESLRGRLKPFSWRNVKQALLKQYGGVADPSKQVNKLHTARMGRDVPVRKFAQEIERLARLAYPELTSDVGTAEQLATQRGILNRIVVEQFIAGLPPMLSRPVVERQLGDWEDVVNLAAHLEEVNARYFRKSTINAFFADGPGEPSDSANTYGSVPRNAHTGRQHPRAPYTPRGRGTSAPPMSRRDFVPSRGASAPPPHLRDPVRCFRCHELGHVQRDCPRCFICGEGHATASCTRVVCAKCQKPGHPANRCSKNSTGHPSPPTTS